MTSALIIDIILAAIFVFCVYMGARNGFVRSVLSLVSTVVSLVLAFTIVGSFSNTVADKFVTPAVSTLLGEKVDETLGESGDDLASTLVSVSDKVVSMIDEVVNPDQDKTETETPSSEKEEEDLGMDGLVTSISSVISRSLTAFVLFVLLFALINAILKVAIDQLSFVNKVPIVGPINITLGLILGAATGAVFLFIPVWVILDFLPELLNAEPLFSVEEMSQCRVLKFVIEKLWM